MAGKPLNVIQSGTLRRELEQQISGEVRFDAVSRALYSTDASVYQIHPLGVVIVKSREDILRTVNLARAHGVSITARGGGTSQAGQAIGSGLQLDTSKYYNRIVELNVAERWAVVEPGIVLDELNAQLKQHGLRFAPDISTASRATIGGMISNNSCGARSVMYGKTIDHVLELDVVLSDGSQAHFRPMSRAELEAACQGDTLEARCYREVRRIACECADEVEKRYPKVVRRVGGYNLDEFVDPSKPFNLAKIIVGSEGTLAMITAAKINLVPLPKEKAVLAIEFEQLLDALAATPVILKHKPSAIEVMDSFILNHARENPAMDRMRRAILQTDDPGALLNVELYADRAEDLPPRLEAIERDLKPYKCVYRRLLPLPDQARVWGFREASLGLSMAMKGDEKSLSFVEDTAVKPEVLRDYIDEFLAMIRRNGSSSGVYAHASVGCLHVRPVVNMKTADGVARFEAIATQSADLVLKYGGALSGEHGDGLVRGFFMEKMFGTPLYQAFRTVKHTFDPHGVFNPGKIVDCPPLTTNLRYGAGYKTPDPHTYFDYSEYGGFGRAVEMCSGVGACRKKLEGTMCPSYMATRDEKDVTRGRANTLRLAMTGRLADAGLGDEGVLETLDLCLECRACKAECPVGVDVARFKSEFLAKHWKKHGIPLGKRVLGNVRALSKVGSQFAPLSNALAASGLGRWMNEKMFGIDRRRTPPAWVRETFAERFAKIDRKGRSSGRPASAAILFNDTFTNYNEPENGVAATVVLRAAGVDVHLAPHDCCGRPLISTGQLDAARALARTNADALFDAASRGEKILFLEPSCLSAVREDAPALLRGEEQRRAQVVADACVLFEDYLERELAAGRLSLALKAGPSTVVLHGHCHQKAMGLVPPARALLSRIPSCTVVDLDSGCCGMAGSFGYSKDHYDVSKQIGERRLLPAARALKAGELLAAAGTSCRHQVAHFAGAEAQHPAVILHSLID
ncbi:MAG TPA: FAD-linked oxidase C-terminal domain-containing protein [Vicinamibacterales bacterium]